MAFSIGDLLFSFRGDSTLLKKDAEKAGGEAGDKAGKTFGQKFAIGAKAAAGGIAGGMAVALGAGLISRFGQLERATADFRRETGATAEEATKAGKAINDMAGSNIQPVEEIGKTLAAVTVQMGLSGDAAAKLTDQILKYAQATGQNATDAVNDLDDIQDSWNMTAGETQALMDKLIVSHQKWGGSIADNQKTLAQLAPAMKAANMTVEDGIGLLGLFGSKGLDAAQGSAAFAKALTKVKSPKELQDAIDDISGTANAFDRARKAQDLFGAKAGAKLANALAGAHIKDYKVSLDEARGATDRAAAASLTLADKVKMAFGQAATAIVDTLGPAGPMLQAVAGLAVLLGPTLASVGKKIGIALGASIGAAMGPEIVAQLVAATAVGGVIFAAAAILSIAIPVVFVVKGFDTETPGRTADERALIKQFLTGSGKLVQGNSMRQVDTATTVIREFQDHGMTFLQAVVAYIKKLEWSGDQVTQAYTDLAAAVARGDTKVVTGLGSGGLIPALRDRILGLGTPIDPGNQAAKAFIAYQERLYDESANAQRAAGIRFQQDSDRNHAENLRRTKEALLESIRQMNISARKEAGQVPQSIGDGLRAEKGAVRNAMVALRYEMEHPITEADVQAYAQGRLHSKRLADGIRSGIPAIRQAAIRAWAAARITTEGFVLDSHGRVKDHNAAGTNFWRGGATWVGERGPELAYLPRGTQILNHQASMDTMQGGSSKRVDFYVHDSDGGLARAGIGTAALANALRRWED